MPSKRDNKLIVDTSSSLCNNSLQDSYPFFPPCLDPKLTNPMAGTPDLGSALRG